GVGLHSYYADNVHLRHNTIADNGETGIREQGSTLTLTNTLISGHTYGIRTTDTEASVQSDHTLWFNNTSNTAAFGGVNIVTSDDFYGDPRFVAGSDPFAAYHLTETSLAIDAGVATDLISDIDGEGRAPDIGADEYPYVLTFTPSQRRT